MVQDCSDANVLGMELPQSCTELLIIKKHKGDNIYTHIYIYIYIYIQDVHKDTLSHLEKQTLKKNITPQIMT